MVTVTTAYNTAKKEFKKAKNLVKKLKIETEQVTNYIAEYPASSADPNIQKNLVIAYKTAAEKANENAT